MHALTAPHSLIALGLAVEVTCVICTLRCDSIMQCSGDCCDSSQQMKHRTVQCADNETLVSFPDIACTTTTTSPKPATTSECIRSDCANWTTFPWGECSTSCEERGVKTRLVQCVGGEEEERDWRECCGPQPLEVMTCNEIPCSLCNHKDLADLIDCSPYLSSEISIETCHEGSFWQQLCGKTCCKLINGL